MGPSAIRYAGLESAIEDLVLECSDAGDMLVPRAEERDPEAEEPTEGKAKYLRETADVCSRLADEVSAAIDDGYTPLALGGDHSIAIGTLNGAARNAEIGAIWFDAHGDFNTPKTSPSGNVHGMPMAATLGIDEFSEMEWAHAPTLQEENVAMVGIRSLDDVESRVLWESDVTVFTMPDIDERGITDVVREALEIASDGVDEFHVSLDLDMIDPNEAPGVGTPVRGGVSYREAHAAMELVHEYDDRHDAVRSMELVEVNPILDQSNETAQLATELAASAIGKSII
jgi:arginase